MNWGNKLVVVFIAFALFMGYMVYRALSTKYDLVSKDYYKDELRYQERIDGVKNAVALDSVTIAKTQLLFKFNFLMNTRDMQ
jgi:hypothetical protein